MKTALITGASGGIGKELSIKFASSGYNLILISRNSTGITDLKSFLEQNYKIKVHTIIMNLMKIDEIHKIKDYLESNNLTINVLVNNAGFGDYSRFDESELQKQIDMTTLNVTSLMSVTHQLLPFLKRARGNKHIINLSSMAALQPFPYMSVYAATKSFVKDFGISLAYELRGEIYVSNVFPGPTDTNFQKIANAEQIFNKLSVMTPKQLAEIIYNNAINKHKIMIIPTFTHKVLNFIFKVFPEYFKAKIVVKIIKGE